MNDDHKKRAAGYEFGKRVGQHQAFDLVAKRCTAADAEILKSIRDKGEYKNLGLTWAEFCEKELGVSKAFADRQIQYIEEYGAAYFRVAEIIQISGDTYKLIAGSVTDEGIEVDGEQVPLTRANRKRVAAAVKTLRERHEARRDSAQSLGVVRKRMDDLLTDACQAARLTDKRIELMKLLMECCGQLDKLTEELRLHTIVVG
jgi:hypothetical protein